MHDRSSSRFYVYGIPLLVTAIALLLRWQLHPLLGQRALYSTFFPSVLIAAHLGGLRAGLLVTLFSAIAANLFLVEPFFVLRPKGTGDTVALLLFGSTGIFISILSDSLQRAQLRILAEERHQAAEKVRRAEEHFRYLVQNSSDIINFFDAEGTILYQTPATERLLGHHPKDRIGKNVFINSIVHPDDVRHKRAFFDTILSHPAVPVTAEFRLRHVDGSWRHFEAIGQNLLDEPCVEGIVANYRDITERKRAEQALRDSETRFRTFAEHASDAFFLLNDQNIVIDINHQAAESLGYTRDELVGMSPLSFDPDMTPHKIEELGRKLDAGETIIFDSRHQRKDGTTFPVEARGRPWRQEGRRVTMFLVRDMTARKMAEDALRESEARFRGTFENAAVGIVHASLEGRYLHANQKYCEIVGYSREELLGMSFQDLTYVDDLPETLRKFVPLTRGDLPSYFEEKRIIRRDGTLVWINLSVSLQRDAAGHPIHSIAVVQDISERKRLEAELRQANNRLELGVRGSNIAIWDLDLPDGTFENGRLYAVNLKEPLGYDNDLETDHVIRFDMWHPDDRERVKQAVRAFFKGETKEFSVEFRIRHHDGTYQWRLHRGVLVRNVSGRPTRFIGSSVDITDLKQMEEELREAKETAEAANRAKDEFLANVSHEIRTPMNAIIGMTELALDTPLSDNQRQCLKTVKSAADNLLGIINDLLDFSKIEAGKLELDIGDFSLQSAIGETLRALAVRAHMKGLELVCNVQADVPDALIGDAGRLRQILLNLVGNAVKFTERGEVVVGVETVDDATAGDDVTLRFTVNDTGIGIPIDKQETIFRAFEQEDTSTTRRYGGTGLGLTIATQLVALMGGKITVSSDPGRGSTFSFTARFALQSPSEPHMLAPSPELLQKLRVLVVDDNATNRRILESWLRNWQMEPVATGDAVTAMDALWHGVSLGRPYSLVLLDGRMPDADGLTLAAKIRERNELSAARIILLTSGDRPGDTSRSRELQINAHLLKPIQQEELLTAIYRVMTTENKGAKYKVDEAPERIELIPATSTRVETSSAAGQLRILVAEDNEFNVQLLEQLLVRRGYHVRLAKNGVEALQLLDKYEFDVLMLDIHMPEMDGFQVIHALREKEQATGNHLPVIALTARSRQEDRDMCLAAGMDDFLPKPIQASKLWEAIERMIHSWPSTSPSPTPVASDSRDLLDPRALLSSCGSDPIILQKICQAFQAGLPAQLTAIQAALHQQDVSQLREAAHKLCGMIAAFSTVAATITSNLEDQAAAGQIDACQPLVEQLTTVAEQLIHQVDGVTLEALQRQLQSA